MKFFVVLVFLSALVYGSDEDYFRKLDALTQEITCSRQGGTCTFAADCAELAEESGLCPEQQSQGVECCTIMSERETRCERLGGRCTSDNCFTFSNRAKDCASGEKCCILMF